MNLVNQLQTHYGWTPSFRTVFKKPAPQALKLFKVPQTIGYPGWIVFTYENSTPVCVYITQQECRKVPCIVDERLCGDTFLKVEKVGDLDFAVSDIWMYNGNCVFSGSTFEQRYKWLKDLLERFTRCIEGVTIDLIHKDDLDLNEVRLRGYECYTDEIGKFGIFEEYDGTKILTVKKLSIPDCYEVEGGGYLKVPDIKTSVYLRGLGKTFQVKCVENEDGGWSVIF